MAKTGLLSPVGEMVRRHDPDRYVTALFAPPARREALFILYAFNHELARAREVVREPFAALIRLQWWREVIEGARRRHEVAGPLGEALDEGWLHPASLDAIITAREAEAEPFETLADFETYALGAAGGVMVAAGQVLGMQDAEALRPWGAAYGVAGLLRSIPAHARQGRCLLPHDMLHDMGLTAAGVIAMPGCPALDGVKARLSGIARGWAAEPAVVPRGARAAALPVILARRRLRGGSSAWDMLAVAAFGLLGRPLTTKKGASAETPFHR